jgi:hypothetical protein
MPTKVIDLADYTRPPIGVLAGRDKAELVRQKERLDRADRDPETRVLVKIPDWVFSVNSSFSLGLFGKSVATLGAEKFREKYTFEGPNADDVQEEIIRKSELSIVPLPSVKTA